MALFTNKQFAFMVITGALVGVVVYYKGRDLVEAGGTLGGKVLDSVNPTHQDNLANRLAEYIYGGGFDGRGSIGSDVYEVIHEDIPAWWAGITGGGS